MSRTIASAELRATWRLRWLSSIEEFANLDVQRRTWLNPENTNPHFSFVEYICCYFDDLSLTDEDGGYETRLAEGLLTRLEVNCVLKLHSRLNGYIPPSGDDYDHAAIMIDPKWLEIVDAAVAAQSCLVLRLTDKLELAALAPPPPPSAD